MSLVGFVRNKYARWSIERPSFGLRTILPDRQQSPTSSHYSSFTSSTTSLVPISTDDPISANSVLWQQADELAGDRLWQDFERKFRSRSQALSIEEILAKLKASKIRQQEEQRAFWQQVQIQVSGSLS